MMKNRYEGDTTTCQRCDHIHHLMNELISFCEKCNYDMRLKLTSKLESDIIENLDYTYKKMRIDDQK